MDFSLTEQQKIVRDTFSRFCDEKVKPVAAEIDEAEQYPRDLIDQLGELGFYGLLYPASSVALLPMIGSEVNEGA